MFLVIENFVQEESKDGEKADGADKKKDDKKKKDAKKDAADKKKDKKKEPKKPKIETLKEDLGMEIVREDLPALTSELLEAARAKLDVLDQADRDREARETALNELQALNFDLMDKIYQVGFITLFMIRTELFLLVAKLLYNSLYLSVRPSINK